jgi:catechol 2,3-dioxygenase-like lactoylglutathione lyase family enzyme
MFIRRSPPCVNASSPTKPSFQTVASMKYLRLRQICLVAPSLAPAVDDVRAVLGLEPVYHDPAVAKYGLENAIFALGCDVLEIVAPIEADTAAERFLKRSGGRGGYMVILDCDDPEQIRRHAEALGIRIANVIDHHPYRGIQLHPRDCRAAMIEFNHTIGGDALDGPYHPGGPSWPQAVRSGALLEAEIESPNAAELARHWSKIMDRPLSYTGAHPVIHLDHGSLRFVRPKGGTSECLGGLLIEVPQPDRVRRAAAERGLTDDDGFRLYGVRIRVVG